jgi:hypothetical protein
VNNELEPLSFFFVTIQGVSELSYLGVSTDSRNHVLQKLFPVVTHFHKVHGIESKLTDLNFTRNERSETTVNCATLTLKDCGLLTKFFAFLGADINTNFGLINGSGS